LQVHFWGSQPPWGTGLEELRGALHHAGLLGVEAGVGQGAQPVRGPAFVAPLPLTPLRPPAIGGVDVGGALRDLREAMRSAGL
jgi:hypothetical protein